MDDHDIAIVGVGCRFPGADNLQEFWRVLLNGENHVTDIPRDRWNNDAIYDADKDALGKIYVKKAGLLKNHDEWDNKFFGVSDVEAGRVDPQQRYVLECTHMALEDAGITKTHIDGSQTGVYIGCMNDDYKNLMFSDPLFDHNTYGATGASTSIIASRVSYVYNLQGPCLTLDTACSSALIAIHLGSQAIRTGDCDRAICGGVSSITNPDTFKALCKARMMSETGQCQTFCDTADGYARGEGCGIVILMKLKDARRDNVNIWGVIKTGSNQDGRVATPITAPSGDQQMKLLKQVYEMHQVDPADVQYIEAHGTGTAIGDPTEANALGQFFSKYRKIGDPLVIGSVKSNIGHTESAAGVAGLLKVLLMMNHGKVVPSLHVKKDKSNVNQKIKLEEYNLDIALQVKDWKPNESGKRIACINSFGFGGSNCHAIVSTPCSKSENSDKNRTHTNSCTDVPVIISASDKTSLGVNLDGLKEDMEQFPISMNNLSHSSISHREQMQYRALLIGKDSKELTSQIEVRKKTIATLSREKKMNIVFVYCGVGTTWTGMCTDLMQVDTFRKKVEEIDIYFEPLAGWRIAEKFSSKESAYDDPFVNHVCIFAAQVCLTAIWLYWNIKPDMIVGQSVGEVAAAYTSGIIPLQEAVRVIYHRSKILANQTGGSMMVVKDMPLAEIDVICKRHEDVEIAVYSSSVAGTLSGKASEIKQIKIEVEEQAKRQGKDVLARELNVKCAYHSPLIEGCTRDIETCIGHVQSTGKFEYTIISTVSGAPGTYEDFTSGRYWAQNVRRPVKFFQSLQAAMIDDGQNILLEIGPRQVVRAHFDKIVDGKRGVCLPSMNAGKGLNCMHTSLSDLYQIGYDINWNAFHIEQSPPAQFPRYRFNKSKHLFLSEKIQRHIAGTPQQEDSSHMFLKQVSAGEEVSFKMYIDQSSTPYVFDHRLSGDVILPGATHVDVGFQIGSVCLNKQVNSLELSVDFQNPIVPAIGEKTVVDVNVDIERDHTVYFKCQSGNRTYASGKVTVREAQHDQQIDIQNIIAKCPTKRNKHESYACLHEFQFQYGPLLSLIEQSWSTKGECLIKMSVPEAVTEEFTKTRIHPALVDAIFQMFGIMAAEETTSSMKNAMPKGVKRFVINRHCDETMYAYAREMRSTPTGNHYNAFLLSTDGYVIAELHDFHTRILNSDSNAEGLKYATKLSKVRLKPEQDKSDNGSVIVCDLDDKMERNWFSDFVSTKTHFKTIGSIQNLNGTLPKAVVMHVGCPKTESNVLDSSLNRFCKLKEVLAVLSSNAYNCPLFIVTENCQSYPERLTKEANIIGSEYWGMVRSARQENIITDIRLIDVNPRGLDLTLLEDVFMSNGPIHAELCLSGSEVYHVKLQRSENNGKLTRDSRFDFTENAILLSRSPLACVSPWFASTKSTKSTSKNKNSPNTVHVRPYSVVQHDRTIFPVTETSGCALESIWAEDIGKGFKQIVLEGRGTILTKDHSSEDVIFCYPTSVTTPYVEIPANCVIPVNNIPSYKDGLFMVLSVLYRLTEAVPLQSSVMLVRNRANQEGTVSTIEKLLARRRCTTTLMSLEELTDGNFKRTADSSIILVAASGVNATHVQSLVSTLHTARRIITLSLLMPQEVKSRVQLTNPELQIVSIDTTDALHPRYLMAMIPEIVKCLPQLGDTSNLFSNQGLFWEYPVKVLSLEGDEHNAVMPLRVGMEGLFRTNGCYIVIGGLTGLGWCLLRYMAELGAGHISTFSRRGPSNEQMKEIQNIEKKFKCKVYSVQADVSDLESLKTGISSLHKLSNDIPIRGIFHGAGVLSDGFLSSQTDESVRKVLSPKIQGSWNLHLCSRYLPLDYFVMHSSVVSILGNPGQTNYAAANSYMDSLAAYRRANGDCAQSINWGALAVGMAANNKSVEDHLRAQGFDTLSEDEIRDCFTQALLGNETHCCFAKINWDVFPNSAQETEKFEGLIRTKQHAGNINVGGLNVDWAVLSGQEKEKKMLKFIRKTVCEAFVITDDNLDNDTTFASLGVDSMAALGFTNTVFSQLKVRIPMVKMLADRTSVTTIVEFCIQNLRNTDAQMETDGVSSVQILDNDIPFMQDLVLRKYFKNTEDWQILDMFEIEIQNFDFSFDQWKQVIRYVMHIHPNLRKRYTMTPEGKLNVVTDEVNEDLPALVEVPFKDMVEDCEKDTDLRKTVMIDLATEHPIKFHIALGKKYTILRITMHKVVSDLQALVVVCNDINMAANCIKTGSALPEKMHGSTINSLLKEGLKPQWKEAEKFWSKHLNRDIRPISVGNSLRQCNLEDYTIITEAIPDASFRLIENYLETNGFTLFHLVSSLYQLTLHLETSQDCLAVMTAVDMRVLVPALANEVLRGVNGIPLVATFKKGATFTDFLLENTNVLKETMDHSGYPTKLILDKIRSPLTRDNIGRHYVVMDQLDTVNEIMMLQEGVKTRKVLRGRTDYETQFFATYDGKRRTLSFELGFDARAFGGKQQGSIFLKKFIWMISNLTELSKVELESLNQAYERTSSPSDGKKTVQKGTEKQCTGIEKQDQMKQNDTRSSGVSAEDDPNRVEKHSHRQSLPHKNEETIIHEDANDLPTKELIKGYFHKETSQGWTHKVHVVMEKKESHIGTVSDVIVKWGKNRKKAITVSELTNIHLRKMNGMYGLVLTAPKRHIVLKTPEYELADKWINTLRDALQQV